MKSSMSDSFGLAFLCTLFLIIFVACGDKDVERKVKSVEISDLTEEVRLAGPIELTLVPEEPTVQGDIKAVVSGDVGSKEISFRWRVEGKEVKGVGEPRLEKSNFVKGQNVSATVIVGSEVFTASRTVVNSLPEVLSVSLVPNEIYAGVDVTVEVVGFDADGDDIGYNSTWFINGIEQVTVFSNKLEGQQFTKGNEISVEVVPYDVDGDGELFAPLSVTVPNGPPRFVTLPELSFTSDTYTYKAAAIDPDGDELTFGLRAGPAGMKVSKDGLVTWKIGIEGVGTHEVELLATDSEGAEAFQKYEFTIEIR